MGGRQILRGALLALAAVAFLSPASFAADAASIKDMWIVSVFKKGGPMMWPILVCSIFTVAISIERAFQLRRKKVIHPEFLKEVREHWLNRDFENAVKSCRYHDIAMARIVRAGLLRSHLGVLR